MKRNNLIDGRYLAELTKEMMNRAAGLNEQYFEWRVSIYGNKKGEWTGFAKWIDKYQL
jgi:AMP deaminase